MLDWNYERYRTRDLLLEYDKAIMPPMPRAAGISMVYPWENLLISNLIKQLFMIAITSGFEGTEEDFKTNFGTYLQNRPIVYDIFDNFPEEGNINNLYFDLNEKILYYWDNEYIPVNTLLIENTTLNAGSSTESVE